ncbi:hypothetical protein NC652_015128 [Populus alba x Populus x berolinensis]|nr:hypothetical protein NC652_015128 [Populus alba x Populus x berolinensis]
MNTCMPLIGETGIQNDVIRPNQGVGTILVSPSCCTDSEEINISVHGTGDDFSEQLSQDGVTKTLESASIGGSLDTNDSAGGSDEDATDITKNDKKIEVPQLDLSRTDVSYLHLDLANMVTSTTAHWVDKTLRLCFEDSAAADLTDVSAGKDSVRRSDDVGPSNVSPRNEENRKFSAPQLELNSPLESDVDEGPVFAGNSTSVMEVPSNSGDGQTLPEEEAVVSDMDFLCTSDFLPAQKRITASLENCSAGEHTVAAVKDAFEDDGKKDVQFHFAVEELAVTKVTSRDLVVLGGKDIINAIPVVVGSSNPNDSMDVDAGEGDKMDIDVAEEQVVIDGIDVEDIDFHGVKNDSPCMSNNLSSFEDGFGVSTINSTKNPVEKVHGYHDKILAERPAINVGSNSSICTTSSQSGKIVLKSDHAVEGDRLLARMTGHFPSQDSKITTRTRNAVSGQLYGRKNQTNCAVSKIYPGRSSFVFTASKSTASSSRNSKTQTWHRTHSSSDSAPPAKKAFSSTVHAQMQFPRKTDKLQSTSYIRKGNSLVRKPISVAQSPDPHGLSSSVYQLNSSGTNEPKKSTGSDSRIDIVDPLDVVRKGGMNASCERPRTPPLSSVPKIPNQATNALGVRVSSPLAEHLHSLSTETATAPAEFMESNEVPKSSDNLLKISESPITQNSQINNLECNGDLNEDNKVVLANVKNLTYVKKKSNQLVATSNPCASSVQNACNTSSSDSHYKKRRNQLIRTFTGKSGVGSRSPGSELKDISGLECLGQRPVKPSKFFFVSGHCMDVTVINRMMGDSLHHGKEATLAVAAVERKNRERRGAAHGASPTKSRNMFFSRTHFSYWLSSLQNGLFKADSSEDIRWSFIDLFIVHILGDESSCSGALQKEKDAKKSYVPRRLMIGKDESFRKGCLIALTFWQGLCTNEVCPYRHVRVNPNASICEGFLRGYCADANEVLAYSLYSSNFLLLFDF